MNVEPERKEADWEFISYINGITVTKTLRVTDDLTVIRFEFSSNLDEPTRVRLVETIDDEFPKNKLGMHPKYGSEKWAIKDGERLVYDDVVQPDEPLVTVYGVSTIETDEVEPFRCPPTLETEPNTTVDTTSTSNETTSQSIDMTDTTELKTETDASNCESDDAQDDTTSTSSDTTANHDNVFDLRPKPDSPIDAWDGQTADEFEEDAAPVGDSDETGAETTEADGGASLEESDVTEGEMSDADLVDDIGDEHGHPKQSDSGVIDSLVEELRARELTDEERAVLQEELGIGTPNSVEARLTHVQTRLDNLKAYTEALEAFIDENGTADDVVQRLKTVQSDLNTLESTQSEQSKVVSTFEERLRRITDEVEITNDNQNEGFNRIEERIDDLEELVAEETVSIESSLEELREQVEIGVKWRQNISSAMQIPEISSEEEDTLY